MVSKTLTVVSGLESRQAALFVQSAGKFDSKITIGIEDKIVSAKSIMGVISLGILDNQSIVISADGADESDALAELEGFLLEQKPQ